MKFKVKNPNYKKEVTESFQRQNFMTFIGGRLADIQEGFCEIHLPYKKELTQQHGYFHAGIISTIADNAAGYAGYSLMEQGSTVLTVEFKLNLLSPGIGDQLIGVAKVLKHGKTLTICRSEVFTLKNGKKQLCAAAQSTIMELRNTQDKELANEKSQLP